MERLPVLVRATFGALADAGKPRTASVVRSGGGTPAKERTSKAKKTDAEWKQILTTEQ